MFQGAGQFNSCIGSSTKSRSTPDPQYDWSNDHWGSRLGGIECVDYTLVPLRLPIFVTIRVTLFSKVQNVVKDMLYFMEEGGRCEGYQDEEVKKMVRNALDHTLGKTAEDVLRKDRELDKWDNEGILLADLFRNDDRIELQPSAASQSAVQS
ncbi:hypothetical protein BDR07DRAFT_1376085 [Suillus spraguei]|nr:hypothetical protein BDR07DRAFT_1376085 [Suillus spraguei]